jgi:uncharacterized membrane protein
MNQQVAAFRNTLMLLEIAPHPQKDNLFRIVRSGYSHISIILSHHSITIVHRNERKVFHRSKQAMKYLTHLCKKKGFKL